jgi:hypothetical protein
MKSKIQTNTKVEAKLTLKTTLIYTGFVVAVAGIIGVLIFFALNLGRNEVAKAAGNFNSNNNGDWVSASNWGGVVPPVIASNDTYFNINHYIVRNGSLSFGNSNGMNMNSGATLEVTGSFSIQKDMTMNINGTLIIHGALNVDKEAQLTVNGNGNIIVYGPASLGKETNFMINGKVEFLNDLIVDKEAKVTLNSGAELIVEGNLSFDKDANITNNGIIQVGNDLTFSSDPIAFNGSGAVSLGGAGCNYWNGSGLCSENQILPIELLDFSAFADDNDVIIQWKTATELNNDYFTIERSNNGHEFSSIAEMEGSGTTKNPVTYEYVDENPLHGTSYYRLKQTDFDGASETFKAVYVESTFRNDLKAMVYPNPFTGREIHLKMEESIKGTVEIKDQNGILIYSKELDGFSSDYLLQLNEDLPKGIYFLTVQSTSLNENFKIVKR